MQVAKNGCISAVFFSSKKSFKTLINQRAAHRVRFSKEFSAQQRKTQKLLTLMLLVGFKLSQGKPRLLNYCYCNLLPLRFYFHAQKDRSTLSCHLSCQRCNCQEQEEVGSSAVVPQVIYRTTWLSLPICGMIKICWWSDVPVQFCQNNITHKGEKIISPK